MPAVAAVPARCRRSGRSPVSRAVATASRRAMARRGSPPAFTAILTSSTTATAGVQAAEASWSEALTHQMRCASASAATCASTAASPVAVWTNQTPSTSELRYVARLPGEEAGVGKLVQRRARQGRDDGDAGAGVEQSLGAACGDRAAADHQHGAAEEAQRRGVNVLNCHASTIGRPHIAEQRFGNTRSRGVMARHIVAAVRGHFDGRGSRFGLKCRRVRVNVPPFGRRPGGVAAMCLLHLKEFDRFEVGILGR